MPTPPVNFYVYSTVLGTATARPIVRSGTKAADEIGTIPLDANEVIVTHPTYAPLVSDDQEIVYNTVVPGFAVQTRTKTTGELTSKALREVAKLLRDSDQNVSTDLRDITSLRRYSEWLTYRKLLRDVPTQAGYPATVVYPTPPSAVMPAPPTAPFFRISAADRRTWKDVLTTTRAGAVATRWNRQGLMETALANTTRVDYDPVTGETLGFLSEPSAQNVCLQSQSIGTAPWALTRATQSLAANLGPFGTSTMTKLISDASLANTHFISQSFAVATAGVPAWVTLHVVSAEYPGVNIALSNTGMTTTNYSFNAATGAMTPAASFIATKKGVDLWEIITYCIPVTTGAGALQLQIRLFDGTTTAFNGDAAKGVFVDCCQVEFGAFPTTYIPTTTAAVTRNADDHDLTFTSDDVNPAAFSVYCEAQYNAGAAFGTAGSRYAFAIDNATVSNLIGFCNLGSTANGLRIVKAGVQELALNGSRPGVFTLVPAAARIEPGKIALCSDGATVQTSAVTNIPQFQLLSPRLRLGRNAGGNHLGGRIRELAIYCGEQLSNAELIALAA